MRPPSHLSHLLEQLLDDPEVAPATKVKIRDHLERLSRDEMLKLLMALYGTKQAGRNWYLLLDSFLKGLGFTANKADHCLYTLIKKI